MIYKRKHLKEYSMNIGTVILCLVWIFPIIYMIITSFKVEESVVPPSLLIHHFTLNNYKDVLNPDILRHVWKSVLTTTVSVIFCIILGVPAAYRIVFGRMKKPNQLYFWFVSTQLLPPCAVLVPAFLSLKALGLLDTTAGLVILYTGIHIPLIIWMVTAFLKDVPYEIIEAADMEGSTRLNTFFKMVLPLTRSGIISAGLLTFIFIWNEFFFAVNLTAVKANTLPVYMASFMTQEGLFWAHLSAIATVSVIIPIALGIFSQKSLVKGLTMGSVKG